MTHKKNPKATTKAKPLDRDRIVDAALDLVRRDGLAELTMRKLARELNAGTMSLYRHVCDRNDMLLAMLDHVARSIPLPVQQSDDVSEIVAIMTTLHDVFRADPWVVDVLLKEGQSSIHILPLIEVVFAALHRLGYQGEAAVEIFNLLLHYTYGESISFETADKRTHLAGVFEKAAVGRFPAYTAAMSASKNCRHREFQSNIARILKVLTMKDEP